MAFGPLGNRDFVVKLVLFVADFWKDELDGGAENNDYNLISYLSDYFDMRGCNTFNMSTELVDKADFLIISNFMHLSQEIKQYIQDNKPYIIYEHDHKYLLNKDPSVYVDYIIPKDQIINKDFYIGARKVFVLSKICKDILNKNIPKVKAVSIGCSIWSNNTFDYIEKLLKETEKSDDLCILKSSNPVKNYGKSLEYCEQHNIIPLELSDPNYRAFLKKMASCKRFLFIPGVLETFSRVCAEAKMLNLSLLTSPNRLGFASEEIFNLSGIDLILALKQRSSRALELFKEEIEL